VGCAYFFLVVQALVVIFKHGLAFRCARVVFGGGVGYVACEDFLPEGEAAGWAYEGVMLALSLRTAGGV
jgi:hypothetical protein